MRKALVGAAVLGAAAVTVEDHVLRRILVEVVLSYGSHHASHPSHLPDAEGNAAPIKAVATQAHARDIALEPYDAVDHLYRNAKSQLPGSVRLAILDTADWSAIWSRIVGTSSIAPVPPVDFSREMLLVVGMGQAPCMVIRSTSTRCFATRTNGSTPSCGNDTTVHAAAASTKSSRPSR